MVEGRVRELFVPHMHIDMATKLNMDAVTKLPDWWYDSCAIIHVCNDKSLFNATEMLNEQRNSRLEVLKIGTVQLHTLE